MLTIIHGADFHLDAPFAALPPDKARARRAEQRELLDRLAGLAEERRADVTTCCPSAACFICCSAPAVTGGALRNSWQRPMKGRAFLFLHGPGFM